MNVHTHSSELAPLFGALADSNRLELIERLSTDEPRSIAQLAEGLGISHQGVTKHLRVLESAGLVLARKRGREKQYVCNPSQLRHAKSYINHVSDRWDSTISRLKNFLED